MAVKRKPREELVMKSKKVKKSKKKIEFPPFACNQKCPVKTKKG